MLSLHPLEDEITPISMERNLAKSGSVADDSNVGGRIKMAVAVAHCTFEAGPEMRSLRTG